MFVLVRPDLEMETLQHDRSVPASLSLLLGPPLLLGGGGAENSGESGGDLGGPTYGEALGSEGGGEEGHGVGLEEIGDQLVLREEVGVPCMAVGLLQLGLGGAGLWVGVGLCRQEAGWEPPRCEHNHTRRPCPGRER